MENSELKPKPKKFLAIGKVIWVLIPMTMVCDLLAEVILKKNWTAAAFMLLIVIFLGLSINKVKRKFCLGCLIFIFLAVGVWIVMPERMDGQWRPGSYSEPEGSIQPEQVPDENNAAKIYEKVYACRDWQEVNERLKVLAPSLPDSAAEEDCRNNPDLSQYLDEMKSELDMLGQATALEYCRFELPKSVENEILISRRCHAFLVWTKMLVAAAECTSDSHEKIKHYKMLVQMGRQLNQERTTNLFICGIGLHSKGVRGLLSAIMNDQADLSEIESIKTIFMEDTPVLPLNRCLIDMEVYFQKDLYAKTMLVNDHGAYRANPVSIIGPANRFSAEAWRKMSAYRNGLESRISALTGWLKSSSDVSKCHSWIDVSYAPIYEAVEGQTQEDIEQQIVDCTKTSALFDPFRDTLVDIRGQAIETNDLLFRCANMVRSLQSLKRGALLACACRDYKKRYGIWPATLSDAVSEAAMVELMDPCCNKKYVYRPEQDGFVLYGMGVNGIDEEGQYEMMGDVNVAWKTRNLRKIKAARALKHDDLMIWPPRQEKSKIDINFLLQ